jgi:hypothetical protein
MERRKEILYAALLSTILLTILQAAAIVFNLYWSYWWYDFIMHFLAGFTGGLATFWGFFYMGIFWGSIPSKKIVFFATILFVLAAGGLWEIAEFKYGILDSHESYTIDVVNDLIMDALGAILATFFSLRKANG